ncbi:hypothetical protein BKA58DRAFT_399535 [Alternaria rosae]|uniref:uncharacterized protein n=1 Tax=Alternaria rosae TaxID=1187941 RepID=UPI001E8D3A2F|nr:uncharacterized protein BKA58DRAFT_399535 [Alternaria rosae]KAH6875315.1 hypothetical protein BKA58DRAFT_399535 [Alternaria rosae]
MWRCFSQVGPEADGEEVPPPANAGFAVNGQLPPGWAPPAPPIPVGGFPPVLAPPPPPPPPGGPPPPPPPRVFTQWELHGIRGMALHHFVNSLSDADEMRWRALQYN